MAIKAFWKFNEISWTSCADATGNGFTATAVNSPTIVDWISGKCRNFAAASSYVWCANNSLWASTTIWFFCFIIPTSTSLNNNRWIYFIQSWGYQLVYIRITNGKLNFITGTWSWFWDWWADAYWIAIANFTAWKVYEIWFTQVWTTVNQYINWVLFSSYTSSWNFATFSGTPDYGSIGNLRNGSGNEFSWIIDEVRIYNTSIPTVAEFKNNYSFYKWFF